jgi:hypothetical protein
VEEIDMAARDPTSLRTNPLATPTGLKSNAVKDITGALNILLAEHVRALPQNEELPLARLRSAFSRLPFDA